LRQSSAVRSSWTRLCFNKRRNIRTRSQRSESSSRKWEAEGWIRGRTNTNHEVVPKAGVQQLVSSQTSHIKGASRLIDLLHLDSTSKEYAPLNLPDLQAWIASGRLDPAQPIDVGLIFRSNLVHGIKGWSGVKLLGEVSVLWVLTRNVLLGLTYLPCLLG
jgi:hypothetical protein